MSDQKTLHIGRSWVGHPLEDACPCPKAPCGLVVLEQASPECDQHSGNPLQARTTRQIHDSEHCPGIEARLSERHAAEYEPEEPLYKRQVLADWVADGESVRAEPRKISRACERLLHDHCLGRVNKVWPQGDPCRCLCHRPKPSAA